MNKPTLENLTGRDCSTAPKLKMQIEIKADRKEPLVISEQHLS